MTPIRTPALILLACLFVLAKATNIGEPCDPTAVPGTCPEEASCIGEAEKETCACNDGFVPSSNNEKCLKPAFALDDPCEEDSQCNFDAHSVCVSSKCACSSGWVGSSNRTTCLIVVEELNGDCEETAQCSSTVLGNVVCGDSKKCVCAEGSVENTAGVKCISGASRVGEDCSEEANICETVENSECNAEEKCACKELFVASLDGETCLAIVPGESLGEVCEETAQCNPKIPNTECVNSECACQRNGFIASLDGKSCLAKVGYGEECFENGQCTDKTDGEVFCAPAEDDKNTCQCKAQNHYITPKCWVDRKLNETCTDKNECIVSDDNRDSVDCKNNMCVCVESFTADFGNNKCNSGVRNSVAVFLLAFAAFFVKMY